MFERNRIDNSSEPTVAVALSLDTGETISGRAALPKSRQVHRLLDGEEKFLYVETFEGEGQFVPKDTIKSLKVIPTERARPLSLSFPDATGFCPYRALGIDKGAPWDEVRAAFHRLTKLYHPDKYASLELPAEVKAYLESKAKEVNSAFRMLRAAANGKAA